MKRTCFYCLYKALFILIIVITSHWCKLLPKQIWTFNCRHSDLLFYVFKLEPIRVNILFFGSLSFCCSYKLNLCACVMLHQTKTSKFVIFTTNTCRMLSGSLNIWVFLSVSVTLKQKHVHLFNNFSLLLFQICHHGECIRQLIQRPVWQKRDENSDGGAGCCWKNDYPVQTKARRDRHHHSHHRYGLSSGFKWTDLICSPFFLIGTDSFSLLWCVNLSFYLIFKQTTQV